MANTKISALTSAAALAGTEKMPGVQSGVNVGITPQLIKDFVNAATTAHTSLGGRGIPFPALDYPMFLANSNPPLLLNAAAMKYATAGYVRILDGSASKTISSAGGKIHFLLMGTTAFAAAAGGTQIDVGIQGVSATAGPSFQPDGTYSVKKTLVSATDTLATGWNSKAMATGSKTVTNGELVSIVFDMTARGGTDQFTLAQQSYWGNNPGLPVANGYSTGAWGAGYGANQCVIEFDDGTLGVFEGVNPTSSISGEMFSSATNPKERGNNIRLPFSAKVSGYKLPALYIASATSDFKISLYSDPKGIPALVPGSQIIVNAEQTGRAGYAGSHEFVLPSEITLTKNADYALIVEATGAGNVQMYNLAYSAAAYKKAVIANGDYISKLSRNGGTGPFTETSTSFYAMGLVISQILAA